ncbi:hypothetical protein NA57DRAFT_56449 [Rhizodiscina lignyota]|uniref:Uncharacterized protein n=1 Tax=Rhizodiscina lignyota TaxID=1504668 RepID=A0A9P4IBG3_9PEZI|nr:hypothetical protein NA57DRAFT_56449 [Rhizodiscina lignyota]
MAPALSTLLPGSFHLSGSVQISINIHIPILELGPTPKKKEETPEEKAERKRREEDRERLEKEKQEKEAREREQKRKEGGGQSARLIGWQHGQRWEDPYGIPPYHNPKNGRGRFVPVPWDAIVGLAIKKPLLFMMNEK